MQVLKQSYFAHISFYTLWKLENLVINKIMSCVSIRLRKSGDNIQMDSVAILYVVVVVISKISYMYFQIVLS